MSISAQYESDYTFCVEDFAFQALVFMQLSAIDAPNGYKRQQTILKARHLIFSQPDVIATPVMDDCTIYTIIQKDFMESQTWHECLKNLDLEIKNISDVTNGVFQSCLNYTITAKLAPQWNFVADYFVQGRNFITENKKMNAICYDMYVSNEEINFNIKAFCIKIHQMKLEDLGIDAQIQQRFALKSLNEISKDMICNRWCHVFPTLKRGEIVKITHTIPPDSSLTDFSNLKRYWKNHYGYRLPEQESDVYFTVQFRMIKDKLFTYPEWCVRSQNAMTLPCQNPSTFIEDFLNQIQNKVENICGYKFQIKPKSRIFPQTALRFSRQMPRSEPIIVPRVGENVIAKQKPMLENTARKLMAKIKAEEAKNKNTSPKQMFETNSKPMLTTKNGVISRKIIRDSRMDISKYFPSSSSTFTNSPMAVPNPDDLQRAIFQKQSNAQNSATITKGLFLNGIVDQAVPSTLGTSTKRKILPNTPQIVPLLLPSNEFSHEESLFHSSEHKKAKFTPTAMQNDKY